MKKLVKPLIIAGVCAAVIAVTAFILHKIKVNNREKKTCDVYSVADLSYDTSVWGNSESLSGSVVINNEQKVYVGANSRIAEIVVSPGDEVKAGDVLMRYDMTQQQLQLQIERTELEISRANIQDEKNELAKLEETEPVEPTEETTTEAPTTEAPTTEVPTTEAPTTEETATNTDATTETATGTDATTEAPTTEAPVTEEPAPEEFAPEDEGSEPPEKTYTAEELEKAIKEKQEKIKRMELEYQLDLVAFQLLEYSTETGEVYANFDGVVANVTDQASAVANNDPLITISGDNAYVVEANVGEFSLDKYKVGAECELYCYDNGMNYRGVVTEISEYPTESGDGYYSSSTVESFYPMKIALIDCYDMMYQGMYMEITMKGPDGESSGPVSSDTFCLPTAFLMRDGNNYYVMKKSGDRLKKVYVKTGKIMGGGYLMEIVDGLGRNDFVAFPYLDTAQEGVHAVEKDTSDLYDY